MITYDQYFYRRGPAIRSLTEPEALVLRIPARRSWFEVMFLCFWLAVAVYLSPEMIDLFRAIPNAFGQVFVFLILSGLAFYWVGALWVVAWLLVGQTVVRLGRGALEIRTGLLGRGHARRFSLSEIKHLRVEPQNYHPWSKLSELIGWEGGTLTFDYLGEQVRFGGPLDPETAGGALEQMREHSPVPLRAGAV